MSNRGDHSPVTQTAVAVEAPGVAAAATISEAIESATSPPQPEGPRVPLGERVLMKGNEALAEAALKAGCRAFFGYPITPASEITSYMARWMRTEGGVFLQSESEVAAINMVFGASAAGVRTMTASSSPGISLMSEGISFLAGAEVPCLVVNVMRVGPGLGESSPASPTTFRLLEVWATAIPASSCSLPPTSRRWPISSTMPSTSPNATARR